MIGNWRDLECYYADCVDAGRVALIAGPFQTHQEALNILERAKDLALESTDPKAWFYLYGTVKMPSGKRLGLFNEKLGL